MWTNTSELKRVRVLEAAVVKKAKVRLYLVCLAWIQTKDYCITNALHNISFFCFSNGAATTRVKFLTTSAAYHTRVCPLCSRNYFMKVLTNYETVPRIRYTNLSQTEQYGTHVIFNFWVGSTWVNLLSRNCRSKGEYPWHFDQSRHVVNEFCFQCEDPNSVCFKTNISPNYLSYFAFYLRLEGSSWSHITARLFQVPTAAMHLLALTRMLLLLFSVGIPIPTRFHSVHIRLHLIRAQGWPLTCFLRLRRHLNFHSLQTADATAAVGWEGKS